jgi:hypothetical protein
MVVSIVLDYMVGGMVGHGSLLTVPILSKLDMFKHGQLFTLSLLLLSMCHVFMDSGCGLAQCSATEA